MSLTRFLHAKFSGIHRIFLFFFVKHISLMFHVSVAVVNENKREMSECKNYCDGKFSLKKVNHNWNFSFQV